MSGVPHVSLMHLTEREDENGRFILTGWLGMAKVIGYPGKDNEFGDPTWILRVAPPDQQDRQKRREGYMRRRGEQVEAVVGEG